MSDVRWPDALILPGHYRQGSTQGQRVDSVCSLAEPLMGITRGRGQLVWVRRHPGNTILCTRSPEDHIFFAIGHPWQGQHRFRWEDGQDGIRRGYAVEDPWAEDPAVKMAMFDLALQNAERCRRLLEEKVNA